MRGNGKLVQTYIFFLALSYDLQSQHMILFSNNACAQDSYCLEFPSHSMCVILHPYFKVSNTNHVMDVPKGPCADLFLSHHLRSVPSRRSVGRNGVKPAQNAELQHGRVRVSRSEFFLPSSWTERYISVIQHSKSWPRPKFGRWNQKKSENILEFEVPQDCSVLLQVIIFVA